MTKRSSKRLLKRASSSAETQRTPARPFAPGYGILGPDAGQGLLDWAWVGAKMNSCRTFWLSTIFAGRDRPHVMPVWGVWFGDAFFFSTGRKSRKGKNLVANSACAVTNENAEEAVVVEGVAAEVEDPEECERVAAAYKKKYGMDPRSMGEPVFRVTPSRVFGLIEKTFTQSATRWKL